MELNVRERLMLVSVLPKEGDITTLKIIRKLREDLSFSEEEHKVLNFKHQNNMTIWDDAVDVKKEIEIGEKATDVITEALETLSKNKKLHEDHLPLWEMFIEKD